MKRTSFQLLFFVLLSTNVFSQNRIDSLKHYYTLDLSNEERYERIHKRVFSHYEKTSDSLKFMMDLNYSLALKTDDLNAISTANSSLGSYYMNTNNEAASLQYYYKALKGFEATKNNGRIAIAYMGIGQVYKRMEESTKSFEFIDKAVKLKESLGEKDYYYHGILIHHGNAALTIDDYRASYKSYKACLEYFKDVPFFRIYLENNLSNYYNELFEEVKLDSLMKSLNISSKQQILDSAKTYLNKTLKTIPLLDNQNEKNRWRAFVNNGLGRNSYFKKNYSQAINYLESTILISEKITLSNSLLKLSYKYLYLSYTTLGNYNKALTNYKKFVEYKDKIQSDENKKALFKQDLIYKHEKEIKEKEDRIAAKNRFIIIISASFIVALIILYLLIKRRRLLREKKLQKQFSQNLLTTQEEERKRISEDLHDGLGQSLLLVKNQLTVKNYDKSKELLTGSIEEMRSIVKTLYPFQLSRVGISIALENLIIQLDENYKNMDFIYEIEDLKGQLTIQQETNVFRIVQECLSNSIKHAQADSTKVNLTLKNGKMHIQIQDNGRGFDVAQKNKELKTLGLKTIKERVDLLNGTLEIDSVKNSGTSFTIKFSIAA